MDRVTCYGCEHLQVHRMSMMGIIPSCGAVEESFVVPHRSDVVDMDAGTDEREYDMTYWRIPTSCPLDAGVHKSDDKAPMKQWDTTVIRLVDVEEYDHANV